MRIGLCAWSFTSAHREAGCALDPHQPEDLAHLALRHGLHSIECAPGGLRQKNPAALAAFRSWVREHRLEIFLDSAGDTASLREALETAGELGAAAVRTTISRVLEGDRRPYGAQGWKAHLKALVPAFKEIAPLAEEYGIPVGIENHQDACSWELCRLCEEVDSPMLGVTMDVGNALAVGETPLDFARRVLPFLKHVHLKDYTVHPTPSGYRLKRCDLSVGVVDWKEMLAFFDTEAPQVRGCIELGAASARHIRILEEDYWSTYAPRPLEGIIRAIRSLHRAARPPEEDWRTPHERQASAAVRAAYEMEQFETSVAYLKKEGFL